MDGHSIWEAFERARKTASDKGELVQAFCVIGVWLIPGRVNKELIEREVDFGCLAQIQDAKRLVTRLSRESASVWLPALKDGSKACMPSTSALYYKITPQICREKDLETRANLERTLWG